MLKRISQFFHNRFVKLVELLTASLMSLSFRMMYYLLSFKSRDVNYVESLATHFANMTAGMLRQVIILKGKDPDYVAPPPAQTVEDVKPEHDYKNISTYQPSWLAGSFKDHTKHPVVASRIKLAQKAAKPKVAAPTIVAPAPSIPSELPAVVSESPAKSN